MVSEKKDSKKIDEEVRATMYEELAYNISICEAEKIRYAILSKWLCSLTPRQYELVIKYLEYEYCMNVIFGQNTW